VFSLIGELSNCPSQLSAAGFFDCLDDDSFCFFAGQICDSQVGDGLTPADLFFCIDRNLGNLNCNSRRVPINNRNLSFLFLSQGITPPLTAHVYFIEIETSTCAQRFSWCLEAVDDMRGLW
jgi:hypothetical protein